MRRWAGLVRECGALKEDNKDDQSPRPTARWPQPNGLRKESISSIYSLLRERAQKRREEIEAAPLASERVQ